MADMVTVQIRAEVGGYFVAKTKSTKKPASKEVAIERRSKKDRRTSPERRAEDVRVETERRQAPRRKVARRRQIDPTTCERDYNQEEIEFMQALDAYKRAAGRMFPTCSEILEVLRDLGYRRLSPEELALILPPAAETDPAETEESGEEDPLLDEEDTRLRGETLEDIEG